jgi:RNA polymerase sigma factor (sigma-70 family)
MTRTRPATLLRYLRAFTARPDAGDPSDGELLGRFVRLRDEAAFEMLVWRHGKMVWNLCRRLLRHPQDAEDAFQATFLALVRKGDAIRQHQSLSSWLYKVAYRVALRARAEAGRRGPQLGEPTDLPAVDLDETIWRDLKPVLDAEIDHLPEKYRAAVILCYLEGHSTAEAAALLGCPKGTVLSRLAWARQRLQQRLTRRGLTLSLAALAAGLVECLRAAPPPGLVSTTRSAAVAFAAGGSTVGGVVSARAVRLMEGVLRTMYYSKLKMIVLLVAMAVLAGAGLGRWALGPGTAAALEKKHDESARAAAPDEEPRKPPEGQGAEARAFQPPRPAGDWERTAGPLQATLHFGPDHVSGTIDLTLENQRLTIAIDADYSVTKDHVLYGILTGVELQGLPRAEAKELSEAEFLTTQMLDQPFSLHYRLDDSVLTLKDVRFGSFNLKDEKDELREYKMLFAGRYKHQGDTPKNNRGKR